MTCTLENISLRMCRSDTVITLMKFVDDVEMYVFIVDGSQDA